ncbi:MAG: hypothetical protein IKF71_02325 [Bacilli bacterium]|nr:hypothetical protein [Bacilli bacterium]
MVSSGNVMGDLGDLKTIGSTYSNEINGLSKSWEGPSHDSLVSKSEAFISEFMGAIEGQMTAFATACDLYERYKVIKQNRKISESNYRKAKANNDRSSTNRFASDVNKYADMEREAKKQIEEYLKSASSKKLSAVVNNSVSVTIPGTETSSAKTKTAKELGASLAAAPHYGAIASSGGGVSYSGGSSSSSSGGSTGSVSSSSSGTVDNTPAPVVSGSANVKGNVIDTSTPVGTGAKYNLSDSDLAFLAYVAKREQGSIEGAKLELSLMANLYEKNKSKYSSVVDYVKRSGWFGSRSTSSYTYPGDSYVAVARDVLSEGNRYLASNVVEHDCLSDITRISTGSKSDKSNYIPGQTIIYNRYGAKYVFVGFAPNGGDPFGYLV